MTNARALVSVVAGLLAGCALVVPLDDLRSNDAATSDVATEAPIDAGADAPPTCDPTSPFGPPTALTELASSSVDNHATLSPDELHIWFASARNSDAGSRDIFTASRGQRTAAFGAPTVVTELSSSFDDAHPSISSDSKTIFFARSEVLSGWSIMVATRSSATAPFGNPVGVAGVNEQFSVNWMPVFTTDGTTLFFVRGTTDANIYSWPYGSASPPAAVTELNSPVVDERVAISADGLWIYWASSRTDLPNTKGELDVFVAHRAKATDPFGGLAVVPEVSSAKNDSPDWLSPDFCRLYVHSDRGGNDDIYVAERAPR